MDLDLPAPLRRPRAMDLWHRSWEQWLLELQCMRRPHNIPFRTRRFPLLHHHLPLVHWRRVLQAGLEPSVPLTYSHYGISMSSMPAFRKESLSLGFFAIVELRLDLPNHTQVLQSIACGPVKELVIALRSIVEARECTTLAVGWVDGWLSLVGRRCRLVVIVGESVWTGTFRV